MIVNDNKRLNSGWKLRTTLFLISQSVTLFGSMLVQMAVVWYVTLMTSSGAWVAAFTVCSYLPQFLISFVGGALADRHNRKIMIILSDCMIAAVTLVMMIIMPIVSDNLLLLVLLLIMSAIRSLFSGIQTPAVNSAVVLLVPKEHFMRYNGINATIQSVVQFAAPAFAGVVLSFGTLRYTLLIDIITAAIGVGILSCVFIPKHESIGENTSMLSDIKTGIKYSFSDRLISRLLCIYGLFIFLCVPAGFLAQLLVSRVYGDTYWYLTAVELAGFFGMTAGGLLMSIKCGFKSRTKTLITGIVAFGLLAVLMGISNNFILYLSLMVLYGIALTVVQTATTTLIQEKAEPLMQGRVFGLLSSMYSGFLPLGMAVFGPMADVVNLKWIMIGSGVMLLLMAAYTILDRKFRD